MVSEYLDEILESLSIAKNYIEFELMEEIYAYKGYEHCSDIHMIQSDLNKINNLIAILSGENNKVE